MIQILALNLMLILLIKVVAFMVFPDQFLDFTEKTYALIDQYRMIIQGVIIAATVVVGVLLSLAIGFYTLIVAGWFWALFYSIFLVPVTFEAIKKEHLKTSLFSIDLKHQLMAACIFTICLCIVTIALLI